MHHALLAEQCSTLPRETLKNNSSPYARQWLCLLSDASLQCHVCLILALSLCMDAVALCIWRSWRSLGSVPCQLGCCTGLRSTHSFAETAPCLALTFAGTARRCFCDMVKYNHVGRPHGRTLATTSQRQNMLVGTDCSGIETPLIALRNLNVPLQHVFSCDNDPNVKKVILANFKPGVFFDDLTQRKLHNHKCLEKPLDLYVAGFPCQPFSAAGIHGGTSDPRGLIIVHIIRFIQKHTPRTFLLENVKGLVSKTHRETFLAIMRCPNPSDLNILLSIEPLCSHLVVHCFIHASSLQATT